MLEVLLLISVFAQLKIKSSKKNAPKRTSSRKRYSVMVVSTHILLNMSPSMLTCTALMHLL